MQTVSDFLDKMRRVGDEDADKLVSHVIHSGQLPQLYSLLGQDDEILIASTEQGPMIQFLQSRRPMPHWFDSVRLQRGQQVFRKYALDVMTLLGAKSLPYCYAASPGNKAIYLSEKMRKTPGKRLLETASFIIAVMKHDSFGPNGGGYIQLNKTRIIHALVRFYIQADGKWDSSWGLPVNQEDMAGTNLAFSYIIIKGLIQARYPMTMDEQEDFLYAWRCIGYGLCIDEELLPASMAEAEALEHAIKTRHIKPSEEGTLLTRELIRHYQQSFPALPAYLVDGQIRYFLGDELANILGLSANPPKDNLVRMINRTKEIVNQFYVNPASYQTMISNHIKLQQRYR